MRSSIIRTIRGWRDRLAGTASVVPTVRVIAGALWRSWMSGLNVLIADVRRQPRPLRIGVDIRPFYEPLTGVGWYLYEILDELSTMDGIQLVAFGDPRVTEHGPSLHVDLPAGIEHRTFDLRGTPPSRFSHSLTAMAHPLMMKLERIDLFFGGNYFLPRTMDAVAARRVIAVHDLTYRKRPELLQAETLENLEHQMQRELARADAVVCVSHATRRDLIEEYAIEPSRVFAVQNGVRADRARATGPDTLDLPEHYILFVSTIEPRKNLDLLVDAFESVRDRRQYGGDLVVAGRVGWKAEGTAERLTTSRWAGSIHHLDYVPRDHLDEIYRRADMFVLPSHYEGFGFPVLEAMSHGVPVITTNISSLPEVGGDAALYFEPGDEASLAAVIERLSSDDELRRRLIELGHDQVARFDWTRAARETVAVFRHVIGSDS